ncbi:glycosyltransferase [Croceicoccus sp. BE223]|uniref:glycosyltransferase n=1 Tax=Croceicoccus sp. BE223 TaxID=2817716 RepID=UPI0028550351|nr:glycosyltransferase [Croceicoccus sp. BE223]MDR7102049.1 glycosyltransferase involved in cell wall biosynthesis [Croceicoccus sp. BE223]
MQTPGRVAILWENFGPSHWDRLEAAARAGFSVTAIQLAERSGTYDWEPGAPEGVEVVSLASGMGDLGPVAMARAIVRAVRRSGAQAAFFCHYEMPGVFLAATMLSMRGMPVFTMIDSKFDDYDRNWKRESAKAQMLRPYRGALAGSRRTGEYLRFLGVRKIAAGYDTLSIARLRRQGSPASSVAFADRPFVVVARLVPKKDIALALDAMAVFVARHGPGRRLLIAGDGPLRASLEEQARALGLAEQVEFRGLLETAAVTDLMHGGLALLMPSTEEQFGLVAIEALACGLPVIASSNCGAVDEVIDNLINGVVIAPRSVEQLVAAMEYVASDEDRHAAMAAAAHDSAMRGDVCHFVNGMRSLLADS